MHINCGIAPINFSYRHKTTGAIPLSAANFLQLEIFIPEQWTPYRRQHKGPSLSSAEWSGC
jgi:hypothetical protein